MLAQVPTDVVIARSKQWQLQESIERWCRAILVGIDSVGFPTASGPMDQYLGSIDGCANWCDCLSRSIAAGSITTLFAGNLIRLRR